MTPTRERSEHKDMISLKFSIVSDPLDHKTIVARLKSEEKAAADEEGIHGLMDLDDVIADLAETKIELGIQKKKVQELERKLAVEISGKKWRKRKQF